MSDELSDVLYRDYVRGFKGRDSTSVGGLPATKAAWLDWRLLPLLSHLTRDASILKIGCGDGQLLSFLTSRGFRDLQGVDLCEDQVAIARSRGLNVSCGDLFDALNEIKGSADAIIAIDLIEHLDRTQLPTFGRLVWRALRPGGMLLLQTPNGEGRYAGHVIYGDLTHRVIFNASSLGQFLRAFEFKDVSVHETGPIPQGMRGTIRWLLWQAVRAKARLGIMAETGRRPSVLTQEFLCMCRKPVAS